MQLAVLNVGRAPVPLDLSAGPAISDADSKIANARTSIEPRDPSQTNATQSRLPDSLPPGQKLKFDLKIEGVLGTGKWNVEIDNNQARLSSAQFVVPNVPLNVKSSSGRSPITFTRGENATLYLENDDSAGYRFSWEFRAGTKAFSPPLPADKNEDGWKVAGKSKMPLEIIPPDDWFGEGGKTDCWRCRLWGIFRNKVETGYLTIRLHSMHCPNDAGAPSIVIPVETELAYYGPTEKSFWSYLILVTLLVLGALCSLYVNYKFPDEAIRSQLRKGLQDLAISIESLSMKLASRLRVLVGVERRVLVELLSRLAWYTAEFEATRSTITMATTHLNRRVQQLELMSRLREEYERLMTQEAPPTIMDRCEILFEETGNLIDALRPSDDDLQGADAKLVEIQKLLEGWKQSETSLATSIAAALNNLSQALGDNSDLSKLEAYMAMRTRFPSIDRLLRALNERSTWQATDVTAENCYELDCRVFRGNQIRRYLRIPREFAAGKQPDEMIDMLMRNSWDSMRRARRLVDEMTESIYADDIEGEIREDRIEIRLDRNRVRAFEPAQLELRFLNPKFEHASALDEWYCVWNFDHPAFSESSFWGRVLSFITRAIRNAASGTIAEDKGNSGANAPEKPDFMEETGWSVAHYFPKARTYNVTVRFRRDTGEYLRDATGDYFIKPQPVTVGRRSGVYAGSDERNRFRAGVADKLNASARVALGLVPIILGLVSGARDQLLRMDLPLALGAVFMAGFSADQVKNLLSQKPKT